MSDRKEDAFVLNGKGADEIKDTKPRNGSFVMPTSDTITKPRRRDSNQAGCIDLHMLEKELGELEETTEDEKRLAELLNRATRNTGSFNARSLIAILKDDAKAHHVAKREWLLLKVAAAMIFLLLICIAGVLVLITVLFKDQYVAASVITDGNDNVLHVAPATVAIPLSYAPAMSNTQLSEINTLSIHAADPTRPGHQVMLYLHVETVTWYSKTAVTFAMVNGDQVIIEDGEAFHLPAGSNESESVCPGRASCAALYADEKDAAILKEKAENDLIARLQEKSQLVPASLNQNRRQLDGGGWAPSGWTPSVPTTPYPAPKNGMACPCEWTVGTYGLQLSEMRQYIASSRDAANKDKTGKVVGDTCKKIADKMIETIKCTQNSNFNPLAKIAITTKNCDSGAFKCKTPKHGTHGAPSAGWAHIYYTTITATGGGQDRVIHYCGGWNYGVYHSKYTEDGEVSIGFGTEK